MNAAILPLRRRVCCRNFDDGTRRVKNRIRQSKSRPRFYGRISLHELAHYVGRPSPIYHAQRWSAALGGAQIYLKREDLNHTGAHKINNAIGQGAVGAPDG